MNIEIGRGKSDITILKIGNSMLGYGQIFNTAETIKTRLYSRAIAFKDGNIIFVFVCVDLLQFKLPSEFIFIKTIFVGETNE